MDKLIEEFYRCFTTYGRKRETFLRMPDGQKHLVDKDVEVAGNNLTDAIEALIDRRLQEVAETSEIVGSEPTVETDDDSAEETVTEAINRKVDEEFDKLRPEETDSDADIFSDQ